eukprot:scaffold195038_cov17-Prasinocladus_malaysianus.AAC.1
MFKNELELLNTDFTCRPVVHSGKHFHEAEHSRQINICGSLYHRQHPGKSGGHQRYTREPYVALNLWMATPSGW